MIFIFYFSITNPIVPLGFICLSGQNFSSFSYSISFLFALPLFPAADQYHVRLHTLATSLSQDLPLKECRRVLISNSIFLLPFLVKKHFIPSYHGLLHCGRQGTVIETPTFMFIQRARFHYLNSIVLEFKERRGGERLSSSYLDTTKIHSFPECSMSTKYSPYFYIYLAQIKLINQQNLVFHSKNK